MSAWNDRNGINFRDQLDRMHLQWHAEGEAEASDGGEATGGDNGSEGGASPQQPQTSEQQTQRNWLPKDLRDREEFQDITKAGELANRYLETKQKLDNAVPLPGEEATNDELQQFYNKLGRPEQPDGYEFDEPPEGTQRDEEFESWFRNTAHKLGLTKQQARGLYNEYNNLVAQSQQQQQQQRQQRQEEAKKELKQELGEQYDEQISQAQRVVSQLGGEELKEALDESGFGDDPRMIRAWMKIAQAVSEDTLELGQGSLGQKDPRKWLKERYPSMNQ
jgi:hypothetical protein